MAYTLTLIMKQYIILIRFISAFLLLIYRYKVRANENFIHFQHRKTAELFYIQGDVRFDFLVSNRHSPEISTVATHATNARNTHR